MLVCLFKHEDIFSHENFTASFKCGIQAQKDFEVSLRMKMDSSAELWGRRGGKDFILFF